MSEYEMTMPFVTVRSAGGPHDDASYVAGYQMGTLQHRLMMAIALDVDVDGVTFLAENFSQAELIAMQFHFIMTVNSKEGEWLNVTFTRDPTFDSL